MDVTGVLGILASIAASLVGFSGLLTAFRSANEALGNYDVGNIRSLLIVSVSALVFALLPLPIVAIGAPPGAWLGLTVLLGANLLFWSIQSPRWMKQQGLRPRRPLLYAGMIAAQGAVGAAIILWAILGDRPALPYLFGVLWFLIAAIVVFVVQVFLMLPMKRPGERG